MSEVDPFFGLAAVLGAAPINVDGQRQSRKGVPEVVYAPGKSPEQTLLAIRQLLQSPSGRVLVSRVSPDLVQVLRLELDASAVSVRMTPGGHTALVARNDAVAPVQTGGVVAVLTAGASDAPVADEAAWVASEMGCRIVRADDVGVAGLHRLEGPLRALREEGADVAIVVAGMDGALPSVVAGLVDIPVIGLPTSIGYGLGGRGVAALLSMLQTCAPGLAVVNIDNGVGAGATAALMANRAAAGRRN